MMLREISAAGDRERTGAFDVAWDRAHASLFFKFGHTRHVTFEMADGRTLAGEDALTALVAELPGEIEVATWRRTAITDETLDLTSDELIALFEAGAPATSNGAAPPARAPNGAGAPGAEPPPQDAPITATGSAILGANTFALLPLGPVLWSDAMANVDDLEAMVPHLPDCLLVLTRPEPQAAAVVAGGAVTDALWMSDGRGLSGDDAARALMASREGELTAYCIADERMLTVLRTLLHEPDAPVTQASDVEAPNAPESTAEPAAPIVTPDDATPTFDLAFAYVGMSGREGVAPSTAIESPLPAVDVPAQPEALTWSTRDPAAPPSGVGENPVGHEAVGSVASSALAATLGPVGRPLPAVLVPIRVLLSLGIYALIWQRATNRELEEFDHSLPARPARSTVSSIVAWFTALVITVAVAALFASTRGSFHLPFNRQLSSSETYYLIAGLALLYLTLILPFNFTTARTSLRRLGAVQEHAGVPAGRRVRLSNALLLVIPVGGKLVLLAIEQRRINAIWKAATAAVSPAIDVTVKPAAAPSTPADAGAEEEVAGTTQLADESLPEGKPAPDWYVSGGVKVAAAAAIPAAEPEPEAGAAEGNTTDVRAEDESTPDAEPAIALAVPENADASMLDEAAPAEAPAEEAAEQSSEHGSIVSEPDVQPVWLRIAAPEPEEAVDPVAADETAIDAVPVPGVELGANAAEPSVDPVAALESIEFIPTRLEIDVDALRGGLTEIAAKWLGAEPAEPVAAVIAATRPGVDDFVFAIAAIRGMEIPGYESRIVRAMAREMHYYATEVLCGV
jgi:hypothetical protein